MLKYENAGNPVFSFHMKQLHNCQKCKISIFDALLIALLLLIFPKFTFAQEEETIRCAVPEHTQAEFKIYRQKLADFYQIRGDNTSRDEPTTSNNQYYTIPVHVYLINYDDGSPPHPTIDAFSRFVVNLAYTNAVFPEQIQFYICKSEAVNSTLLVNKQDPKAIYSGLLLLNPAYAEDNAIRVFINAEPYGRGDFPHGVKLPAQSGPVMTAHEFGHHFGLYHTFNKTLRVINEIPCMSIFPNNQPNNLCPPAGGFPDCGNLAPGNCFGDLISDTNVDPGGGFCLNVSPFWCALPPCDLLINDAAYTYDPPYYNAMSYWPSYRTFTTGQKQRMIDVLENPALGFPPIGGNMSFLIDDDTPECETLVNPPAVAGLGFVDRVMWNQTTGQYDLTTFPRGRIKCDFSTGQSVLIFILDGLFTDANISFFTQQNNPAFLEFHSFAKSYAEGIACVVETDETWQAGAGLTTLDIIVIQRHILGLEILPRPFSWIAADVNNSGSITTLDIVLMRQVILGMSTSFGNVPIYRILPRYALDSQAQFFDDFYTNPFTAVWHYDDELFSYSGAQSYLDWFSLNLPNLAIQDPKTFSFYAIKTGDVY
ncbi:MAG: hypothetical protein SH848_18330 [Saprospiraceae bacterium]|nr:hypothetical protein [Saprospiraceae bacterium]